jgi:hypothetical protein
MTDADLERRLRRALGARAGGVTAQHLRPAVAERRRPRVRWWLPLSAGLAAAAVLMLMFVIFHRPAPAERPIAPAASVPGSPDPGPSSPVAHSGAAASRSASATPGSATSAPVSPSAALPTPSGSPPTAQISP